MVYNVGQLKVTKADMCLDLDELEAAAHLVLEEEEEKAAASPGENINNIVAQFAGLTVIENGAALGGNDNETGQQPEVICAPRRDNLPHLSDSDTSSSDSDSDEESDTSDSTDNDSSDDSDRDESSSDSSELDSDDDTLSENEGN